MDTTTKTSHSQPQQRFGPLPKHGRGCGGRSTSSASQRAIRTFLTTCLTVATATGCVGELSSGGFSASKGPSGGSFAPVVCQADFTDMVACSSIEHELPIPTHFNEQAMVESGQGFQFMATDPLNAGVRNPLGPYSYQPGQCYPIYNYEFMPGTDIYLASSFTARAVSDFEAESWGNDICEEMGVPVRHLWPPGPRGELGLGAGPRSDSCHVQVVNAGVAEGSLYTVILPPSWSSHAPPGTYPIVFNGFYDLHDNVFALEGFGTGGVMARLVAESGLNGQRGVIAVLWNGGGAMSARTMNPLAYHQFADVIDQVATLYHGNRRWIVAYGGSRGAGTALSMASNPYDHDYRIVHAIAVATATRLGDHAQLQSVTYPGLLHAAGWTTGLADAWRHGWTYPECAGRAELTGLLGWQAQLQILTGTTDPEQANAAHSLDSSLFLDGLQAAGTQVYLEVTEHDNIIPYHLQVRYAAALLQRNIPLRARVLVRSGHRQLGSYDENGRYWSAASDMIRAAVVQLADPALDLSGPVPVFVNATNTYHRVDRRLQQFEEFELTDGFFPFSVDLPYRVVTGERFPIAFAGHPGTQYDLQAYYQDGSLATRLAGTIPDDLTKVSWVETPPSQPVGMYSWALEICKPNGVCRVIPSTNTPSGDECLTEVVGSVPNMDQNGAHDYFAAAHLESFRATNWGLSEY